MNKHICKYCGREIGNKGCLVLHERRCKQSPNYIPTERELRSLNKKPFKHSEETKKKMSESRKRWLKNNEEKHVWKRHSKFVSVPCEKVKEFLQLNNISYVEEYKVLENHNFSIDIAFPNKKLV